MKTALATAAIIVMSAFGAIPALAQQRSPMRMPAGPATLRSTLDTQLTIVEREFEGAADAMPEDKYDFAPTNGDFKGVRTFAQQVKHVATANDRFFGSILGQPPAKAPNYFEQENGPDSIKTKAQIMQYLRESFAEGHKAIASITDANAFERLTNSPTPFLNTRASIAIFACVHANDHYGQMVEYLRDNGIVPPASRNRPLANPAAPPAGK
ncbi:MAG: DinB family protein [Acidobacteriota bacterium]|nr:DinB family protein [Acidobacteriota bacterium]